MKTLFACVTMLFAGSYVNAGTWHYLDLHYPGSWTTEPTAICGSSIVGTYVDSSDSKHGFLYDGTSWTTLPLFPTAIDGSVIVGGSQVYNLITGNLSSLTPPEAQSTWIQGVSGSNIAGYYSDNSGGIHGFLYNDTDYITLNYPGAEDTWANGVFGNKTVGDYRLKNYTFLKQPHGFLFDGTNYIPLDYPGAASTSVIGISGDYIVGNYGEFGGLGHGFIYDGTNWTTLDIQGQGATEIYGISGNNILGFCFDDDGTNPLAFIYTIPEPATAALLAFGGVIIRKAKRK